MSAVSFATCRVTDKLLSAQSRSLAQFVVAAAEPSSSSDFRSAKLNSSSQLYAHAICQNIPIESHAAYYVSYEYVG